MYTDRLPICLLTCLLLITVEYSHFQPNFTSRYGLQDNYTPTKCENEQREPGESKSVSLARKRQSKSLRNSWLTNQHKHTLTTITLWPTRASQTTKKSSAFTCVPIHTLRKHQETTLTTCFPPSNSIFAFVCLQIWSFNRTTLTEYTSVQS